MARKADSHTSTILLTYFTTENEVKRKTLTLLEAKCLPKKFFPLAMKYVSQSSNMMPSRSHERNISPYTYVTGKVPHKFMLVI